MRADSIEAPVTKEQWNYIHEMGGALRSSLDNVTAVFAPSCIGHAVLTKRDWMNIKIDDISLAEALRCWERATGKKNKSRRASKERQQHLKMSLDIPIEITLNETHGTITGNTSKTVLRHERHRLSKEERIRRRQNMTKEEREQRRMNRIRRKHNNAFMDKLKHQLNHGDGKNPNPNSYPNNKLRKSQIAYNQTNDFDQNAENDNYHNNNNNNNNYKVKKTNANNMTNKNNNRKENSNYDNMNRNNGQHQSKNENKRKKRRNHMKIHDNRRTSYQKKKFSEPERCSLRLLERCSWPQCNHSCPALTNPLTGEEVRFLELLSSFGLDIERVATALGIDMQTLNNMDRAELVSLLTMRDRN